MHRNQPSRRQDGQRRTAGRGHRVRLLPRFRRFCIARTGSTDTADDLLQATVKRALRHQSLFDRSASLPGWLFRIAQNLPIDQLRQVTDLAVHFHHEELIAITGKDGVRATGDLSELQRARRALQELPIDQRTVFSPVVIDDCTYAEASEISGIPAGPVMNRLERGQIGPACLEPLLLPPIAKGLSGAVVPWHGDAAGLIGHLCPPVASRKTPSLARLSVKGPF
ncbi:RNA polymerase sigma factor [Novosphingobium cyanobacteriorum]|uniref:RNA polymerase sigma factor n=1 Tax=Novosphingobium cyanobacteriorum TaxID=3024215 RepID=A0ABT6CM61_9SPHN|nr:RNA polymerase sigma factor [Novosphingobium cyanobacteriorum]MDF8335006.1 RNA polymerase sigma factor [Novosphingobium cyanobacteriorum]